MGDGTSAIAGPAVALPTDAHPIARRFDGTYRVRFDEADASGRLRASGFVRYLQDLAWRHSDHAGFDRAWYRARGVTWLVRGLDLRVHHAPAYGETIAVTTEVLGWRRVWARRLSEVRDDDGHLLAEAHVDWVLLTDAGRPARLPRELEVLAPAGATFTPSRIDLPPTPPHAVVATWAVRASDVDPMGHMNNATYLDLLDAALAETAGSRPIAPGDQVRLEYRRPALPGTAVAIATWSLGGARAFRLAGPGGHDLLLATLEQRPAGPASRAR
jgi:acyl-CoA thioesterase FadM